MGRADRSVLGVLIAASLSFLAALPTYAATPASLQFDGVNDYVTFGSAASLGVSTFTVEVRFKRTAAGVTTTTGTGGVTAVPLLTKGRGEADGDVRDMNWFLGVDAAGHLVVDYEEGTGQTSPGLNHPLTGTSTIANGTWYHAAATFDGTTLRLYLDGVLDGTLIVGASRLPQSASTQHAALGSALTSAGAAAGYFAGLVDEARVWSVARSEAEIAAGKNIEILAAPGLLGRWGLNEGTGTGVGNSVANGVNGTSTNGPVWSSDSDVPLATAAGLRFGGTNAYANFGNPAALQLSAFTLELWIRRDAAGAGTNTGTGGIPDAIPLLSKGRAEAETATQDINFLFGIRASDGVLCADFEEGAGGASPSLNHPVAGVTPIPAGTGTWHHVAATYDGATWTLYLDGAVEATLAVGRPVAATSISSAALASALTSVGAAAGFFAGAVDEVRIWSVARSQAEIVASMNAEITAPVTNLAARWGLDEAGGIALASSGAEAVPGTVTGSNWSWGAGSPFDAAPPAPPADPTDLTAAAISSSRIDLAWSDQATNESSYEVERSTTGAGGPFTLRATLAAGASSHSDLGLDPSTEYCYRVRAVNAIGASGYAGPACATTAAPPPPASLDLAGATHVTFGDPAALDLATFTVECWFRRDGAGTPTTTGSGGIPDAVPLVAHGAPEADGSNVDMNFFLGIRNSDGVLCADFEEGAGGSSPGLNHPVAGTTPIPPGSGWHHAAATYDGATWTLYLDGMTEATLAVGQPVQSATVQHASLGSALESDGTANGFFDGALDEVRIWSVARSAGEIQANANATITVPAAGLAARWSLDEGSGTDVGGSAGTTVNGTIAGAAYAWDAPAPFDLAFTAPDAPSDLAASSTSSTQVDLAWTDHAGNETSFEIERSTTGAGGAFTLLATTGPNAVSYADTDVAPLTEYCYRVRAANPFGASAYAGPACATTEATPSLALSFGGSAYVTFGDPAALDLASFTLECWFRRDGAGTTVSTGTGGVTDAIPLVTHGTSQSDGSNVDMNFFLGIKSAGALLCADFEEGAGGASPGLNHPVVGTTPIANGVWHHAAATYDGGEWRLYLDGNLEASLVVGQPVQSETIQQAALASSITSAGTAQGFFAGALDEVRIWSAARTQAEIQGTANAKIADPAAGLVARWALDEGSGTTVVGSAGTAIDGTVTGTGFAWVGGAPFDLDLNLPPDAPALVAPPDDAVGVPASPTLSVTVSDPDAEPLTVTFLGREADTTPGADFTVVTIPDTQYYTSELNGATNAILLAQTNWIVANRAARNIAYVATVGDCVEHGDNGGNDIEWQRADAGYSLLEDPVTTGLPDGLPYGITVGNHDQSPNGTPDAGSTIFYNQYFGEARFGGRPYYGGHYGSDNDNWYDLFSASGMDFLVVSFEYDTSPDAAVLAWADGLLAAHASRRAIVLAHSLIGTGNPGSYSAQGQAVYDALKARPNLFLMLCGHVPGEGRRSDTFGGTTVATLMADYQSRTNGGNGWLRILEFSPASNTIRVRTYSPWLDQSETDADSQFDLAYSMSAAGPFTTIGTVAGVGSGGPADVVWPDLSPSTMYEWMVTVSDGAATTSGPIWSFTTSTATHRITATAGPGGSIAPSGISFHAAGATPVFTIVPEPGLQVANVLVDGLTVGAVPNYTFDPLTGDHTIHATFADVTGVDAPAPLEFALRPVAPNPTVGAARFSFAVPRECRVRLDVVDVRGRVVAVVADRAFAPGRYALDWTGRRAREEVAAGVYFLRFRADGNQIVRRFVLVR